MCIREQPHDPLILLREVLWRVSPGQLHQSHGRTLALRIDHAQRARMCGECERSLVFPRPSLGGLHPVG